MGRIPKQNAPKEPGRIKTNESNIDKNDLVRFSFELLERNRYFNLDGTCINWTNDLFYMMKQVSNIEIKRIFSSEFTGKNSTLRVHNHKGVTPPCALPSNVDLEEFWQLRISKNKGGIHGIFVKNIFYIIWIDPQHNMYPNDKYGGLKEIKPPGTCCKERDVEVNKLKEENERLKRERDEWEEFASLLASESAAVNEKNIAP